MEGSGREFRVHSSQHTECLKSNEHDLQKEKDVLYSETVFKALDKSKSKKKYKIWRKPQTRYYFLYKRIFEENKKY